MNVSVDSIKQLREITSCSIAECRKALEESRGNLSAAQEILKKRGVELAAKKSSRSAREGRIEAYVHMGNRIGVLLEINCETDFVARNEDFCRFTRDVALHITALSPKYIKREDVPGDILSQQKDPESFAKDQCLLYQAFVKDPKVTIQDYLNSLISKTGENIIISRFVRFKLGDAE